MRMPENYLELSTTKNQNRHITTVLRLLLIMPIYMEAYAKVIDLHYITATTDGKSRARHNTVFVLGLMWELAFERRDVIPYHPRK